MDNASLHHFLYRSSYYWDDATDDAAVFAARAARRTVLGPDTWIGHGAVVRPGLSIGTGAVVAAGAVVTKDVEPYVIVAGVPAVPLRRRLPEGVVRRLLALAWWDWPHDRLRAALEDFRGLGAEAFLDRHESGPSGTGDVAGNPAGMMPPADTPAGLLR
jgi:phosphonate metabolism protein (transferase hexapeptide repeat family)